MASLLVFTYIQCQVWGGTILSPIRVNNYYPLTWETVKKCTWDALYYWDEHMHSALSGYEDWNSSCFDFLFIYSLILDGIFDHPKAAVPQQLVVSKRILGSCRPPSDWWDTTGASKRLSWLGWTSVLFLHVAKLPPALAFQQPKQTPNLATISWPLTFESCTMFAAYRVVMGCWRDGSAALEYCTTGRYMHLSHNTRICMYALI